MNQRNITNYGSAIGEAIGTILESEIHRVLRPLAENFNCTYVKSGPQNKKGSNTKLILKDTDGNGYNIDSVIINHRFQPLVLIESKYIRYKKHNRDKASWICTAHPKLRETYPTIRKSLAILMGNWSLPSKKLLQSFEIELFEISFQDICQALLAHQINFNWAEKDRETARDSWQKFSLLSSREKDQLAEDLVASIKIDLENSIRQALTDANDEITQQVENVKIIIKTKKGERHIFEFKSLQEAVQFMESFDEVTDLNTSNKPSLIELVSQQNQLSLDLKEEIEFLEEEEEIIE
ncbi:hypothetical protein PCC7424_1834 [Gloeothece citriformis PCC 7424]|uniref:Uncharacterized protein n=1 Tax=Gloeothece citriformis (strain PCC 7424) TaxID=65393 RepID=B7KCG1_GLOC7|nr:hypothetical protein [Gloeothece citriformis]ACK70266.1 hypothetical protein PCC7424_1834 [Gloeothece citriformis PCC 7424]